MIFSMEVEEFFLFYLKAKEKETEERYFNQWVVQLPYMSKDEYVSFKDYCDRVSGKNIDRRPTDVIIKEIEEARKEGESGD